MKGCGTFHTYSASVPATGNIDRSIGDYVTSGTLAAQTTANASRTGNNYNVSVYGNIMGDTIYGAVMAFVTSASPAAFRMALALGVSNLRMVKQDMVTQTLVGATGDYYSVTKGGSQVRLDTAQSCTEDVTVVSSGIPTLTSGSQHFVFTRKLTTTDAACDTAITNTTEMCVVAF